MTLKEGNLCFVCGDRIDIEYEGIEPIKLVAVAGHQCNLCEFYVICDKRNTNNLIARFCEETHFVLAKEHDEK